jgi:hypothetical protein
MLGGLDAAHSISAAAGAHLRDRLTALVTFKGPTFADSERPLVRSRSGISIADKLSDTIVSPN